MQPGSLEMQIADQSSYDVALEISRDWALRLLAADTIVEGFNIGMNVGVAGQTLPLPRSPDLELATSGVTTLGAGGAKAARAAARAQPF